MLIKAVEETLKQGYRTTDIADAKTAKEKILNTQNMGAQVVKQLERIASHLSVSANN